MEIKIICDGMIIFSSVFVFQELAERENFRTLRSTTFLEEGSYIEVGHEHLFHKQVANACPNEC